MNKSDFLAAIAAKAGLSKVDAGKAYDAMVEIIGDELKAGNAIQLVGLGIMSVKMRAARAGVNPKTKEKIMIAESKAIGFKAAKALKDSI